MQVEGHRLYLVSHDPTINKDKLMNVTVFCRRILHRDLKAKNVFLKRNRVKIGENS